MREHLAHLLDAVLQPDAEEDFVVLAHDAPAAPSKAPLRMVGSQAITSADSAGAACAGHRSAWSVPALVPGLCTFWVAVIYGSVTHIPFGRGPSFDLDRAGPAACRSPAVAAADRPRQRLYSLRT